MNGTDEVAKVAGGNAAAIDGVVNTSQSQVASMTQMVASSRSLSDLAEKLRAVLRRFRTDSAAAREREP